MGGGGGVGVRISVTVGGGRNCVLCGVEGGRRPRVGKVKRLCKSRNGSLYVCVCAYVSLSECVCGSLSVCIYACGSLSLCITLRHLQTPNRVSVCLCVYGLSMCMWSMCMWSISISLSISVCVNMGWVGLRKIRIMVLIVELCVY